MLFFFFFIICWNPLLLQILSVRKIIRNEIDLDLLLKDRNKMIEMQRVERKIPLNLEWKSAQRARQPYA